MNTLIYLFDLDTRIISSISSIIITIISTIIITIIGRRKEYKQENSQHIIHELD